MAGTLVGQDASHAVTPTPKIAFTLLGVDIAERDVIVTKKEAYVHILVDLFPYQGRFEGGEKGLIAIGEAAVKEVHQKLHPTVTRFKVDLVEFKDRDDYGAPVWSSVKILSRHEFEAPRAGTAPVQAKPKAKNKSRAAKAI